MNYNFTAKNNDLVSGEIELYLNGDIFCHLSMNDFYIFQIAINKKIEIENG